MNSYEDARSDAYFDLNELHRAVEEAERKLAAATTEEERLEAEAELDEAGGALEGAEIEFFDVFGEEP